MRFWQALHAISLLLLFALAGGHVAHAASGDGSWRVVQSVGDVTVITGSQPADKPKPGTLLPQGAIVTTGSNGRAILSREGQQIVLQPNSRIELTPDRNGRTRLQQSIGEILFKVDSRKQPHFEVNTPYLSAAVKGTRFSVTVTSNAADVMVIEGLVEVRSLLGSAITLLGKGMRAVVRNVARSMIDVEEKPDVWRQVTENEGGWEIDSTGRPRKPRRAREEIVELGSDIGQAGPGGDAGAGAPPGAISGGGISIQRGSLPSARLRSTFGVNDEQRDVLVRFAKGRGLHEPAGHGSGDMPDIIALGKGKAPEQTQGTGAATRAIQTALSDAGRNVSGNSFLVNNRVRIEADFPWTEVGYGFLSLAGLFMLNHLIGRSRRLAQIRRNSRTDYY